MLDSETICSIFEAPDCVYTAQLFESSQPDAELIGLDCWKLVHQMVNTSKRAERNTFQLKEQLHVNKRGQWLLKLWKDMECCRTPWSSYRWWKTWVLLCAALNGVVVKEVQRFLCVSECTCACASEFRGWGSRLWTHYIILRNPGDVRNKI